MRPLFLAFGNKARHGKDTAGEAVVRYFNVQGVPARVFKFADAVYKMCREKYGMTKKDGRLLQTVGDGMRQEKNPNFWIDQLEQEMNLFDGVAVITDMRYTNEADWVKNSGGWVVNVSRFNEDGTLFVTTDRDPNFVSEVQLDTYNYDFYIKSKNGQSDLVARQAIQVAEFVQEGLCVR